MTVTRPLPYTLDSITSTATIMDRVLGMDSSAADDEETVALTGIRKTIAQRMTASASAAPHAWLAMEADVTQLVKLRESKKEEFRDRHGVDLTYLPFMAHAVAQTLLEHPYLNASWGEDKIILRKRINLGIAVATDRGLMVPVVRDADRLSVARSPPCFRTASDSSDSLSP